MGLIKNIIFSKKHLKRDLVMITLSFAISISAVRAGNLDSPGSPGATGYTLSEIYDRLTTNATATEGGHQFQPSADPASSLHTLKEIYDAIPTIDASKVRSGTSYLGVDGVLTPNGGTAVAADLFLGKTANLNGDWNVDTGTLTLACATSAFDGTGNQVPDEYDGSGNGNDRWCMTDSGTAAAAEILAGKIAWVDGTQIVGTMDNVGQQNITPGTSDQAITSGYHDGTGHVTGDADLISSNIRSGVSIFGVDGNSDVVDTSSGDALVSQIVSGKKAWVDGVELTGTLADVGQQIITPGTSDQVITTGYHNGTGYVLGDPDLVSSNIRNGANLFGVAGDANVVNTSSGNAIASEISSSKIAWVDGVQITGTADIYAYGDNSAAKVLTTASAAGTYDASDLSVSTVKKGTTFGVSSTGEYSGFPGTGWTANGSGDGSTALNQTNCENAANWKWFEDANGDGDTTDPEDGECVRTAAVNSDSWNGAEQMNQYTLADTTAASGTSNSVTVSGTPWTADRYKNEIVKIISGTGSGCWGIVKTNTTSTINVYGSWLQSSYVACASTPDATSHIQVFDDNKYDNSFIGDYSCSGNYPNGTVTLGSYPTSGTIALAVADCYDGKRDLLPDEQDRAVLSGTATAADTTSITDSGQSMSVNVWLGQKVLITGGTGSGSYGIIESNTATKLTVASWSGTAPDIGSTFKIIYITPRSSYVGGSGMSQIIGGSSDDAKATQGPLTAEVLSGWRGTRLPSHSDFFGFCGATSGDSDGTSGDSSYHSSGASSNKTVGNYGSNVGRGANGAPNDEYMDLSNSGSWEWLSEQYYYAGARVAGNNACSYFYNGHVYNSYRFRALFRP